MSTRTGARLVSPKVKDCATVDSIMLDVIVALLPALGMGTYLFGFRALVLAAISVCSCMGFELLYCRWMKKPASIKDLSACVTGLLLAMSLPVTAPYWAPVLGGGFAIIVVKQFYGGIGKNFMNPALAARMLLLSFPGMMTTLTQALDRQPLFGGADAVSHATPMALLHLGRLPDLTLSQMMLGQHGGAVGEVSAFMLLLGGLYLLGRRVISWRIPGSFLGTVALLTFLFPRDGVARADWMVCNLLCGGLMLGAIFMATDYATSPVTPRGQLLFGIGCGCLTVVLRYFGSYPEGVGFAILTMNCCVWLLDRVGLPRRFGVKPLTEPKAWLRRQLDRVRRLRPSWPKWERGERGTMPWEQDLERIRGRMKSAGSLAAVIAVSTLCVFAVHRATNQTIMERENRQQRELLAQVMPAATIATETPYVAEDALRILAGYSENELIGHCVEVEVQGFGGVIALIVGVDVNGEVTGVAVTDHREHTGIGGPATQSPYLDQYVGRSGTIRDTGYNAVDAISGATDTCRAITAGVNKALYIASRLNAGDVDSLIGDV